MKQLIIILLPILLLGQVTTCNAQKRIQPTDSSRWETGVDFLGYLLKKDLDLKIYDYKIRPAHILIIKRKCGRGALRLIPGIFLNNYLYSSTNKKAFRFDSNLKAGYELRKSFRKFDCIYGADLVWNYEDLKGSTVNATSLITEENRYQIHEYGCSFFTGGRFFVTKSISVTLETSFNLSTSSNHIRFTSKDPAGNILDVDDYGNNVKEKFFAKIEPVSFLYISYHF